MNRTIVNKSTAFYEESLNNLKFDDLKQRRRIKISVETSRINRKISKNIEM